MMGWQMEQFKEGLRGRQQRASEGVGRKTAGGGGQRGGYDAALEGLTAEQRAQSEKLRKWLTELGVKEGLQRRLQGMSRFGSPRSMIWKYLCDFQDPALKARVKDAGSWLWTCLWRGKRWQE